MVLPNGVYIPIPYANLLDSERLKLPYTEKGVPTGDSVRAVAFVPDSSNNVFANVGVTPIFKLDFSRKPIAPGLKKTLEASCGNAEPALAIPCCFCP